MQTHRYPTHSGATSGQIKAALTVRPKGARKPQRGTVSVAVKP